MTMQNDFDFELENWDDDQLLLAFEGCDDDQMILDLDLDQLDNNLSEAHNISSNSKSNGSNTSAAPYEQIQVQVPVQVKNQINAVQESDNAKPAAKQQDLMKFFKPDPIKEKLTREKEAAKPVVRNGAIQSHHSLNVQALGTWIYPINYSRRDYQFNISQTCIKYNTLVCLPTGLGKTFIAAVVIYNYISWFPQGIVVFMAPTRPLVSQQIEACFRITGIEREITAELTGTVSTEKRRVAYTSKRLLFMTPETFRNDLVNQVCDASDVVLVVFDEAHKASGNYAYCDIVKTLTQKKAVYRVLALSATPGSDNSKVQAVIDNLHIERLEIRTEESVDVEPYVFKKSIQEIIVEPCAFNAEIIATFSVFVQKPLARLVQNKAYYERNPMNASFYGMMQSRNQWRTRKGALSYAVQRMVEGDFALAIALVRFLTTLVSNGIALFHKQIQDFTIEIKKKNSDASKAKLDLIKDPQFVEMIRNIDAEMSKEAFCSHPKIAALITTVQDHFEQHFMYVQDAVSREMVDIEHETRIMIFTTLRESVEEIVTALAALGPSIRPTKFFGQAEGKKKSGMKQKEQLQVIQDFQNGTFNVLVATSIGEEGLDIGDLDLIICFDNQKSPIRMLQRCGRTGRKREGKICLLINKGREEMNVKKSRDDYKSVQKNMVGNRKLYDGESAAILPEWFKATCVEKCLVIPEKEVEVAPTALKNGHLSKQHCLDYRRKNNISFENVHQLRVDLYSVWQCTPLPVFAPQTAVSGLFVSTMAYNMDLKALEQESRGKREVDAREKIVHKSSSSPLEHEVATNKKPKFNFNLSDVLQADPFSDSDSEESVAIGSAVTISYDKMNMERSFKSGSKTVEKHEPSKKPEVISPKPAVISPKPEVISPKLAVISPKHEVISPKPEVISSKPDIISKPDAISPKSEIIIHPEVISQQELISANPFFDSDAEDDMNMSFSPVLFQEDVFEGELHSSPLLITEPLVMVGNNDHNLDLNIPHSGDPLPKPKLSANALIPAPTPSAIPIKSESSDFGFEFSDVEIDFENQDDVVDITFFSNEIPEQSIIPITPHNLRIQHSSQSVDIAKVQRKNPRNLVFHSSSVDRSAKENHHKGDHDFIEPTPQKPLNALKRRAACPSASSDVSSIPLKSARRPKSAKVRPTTSARACEFFDLEAQVSSGASCSEDEEGSWMDKDISQLIAPAELGTDELSTTVPAFYLESLLKDNVSRRMGGKYRFSKEVVSDNGLSRVGLAGSSENDSLGSLEGFVCRDSQVLYEEEEGVEENQTSPAGTDALISEEGELNDFLDF